VENLILSIAKPKTRKNRPCPERDIEEININNIKPHGNMFFFQAVLLWFVKKP